MNFKFNAMQCHSQCNHFICAVIHEFCFYMSSCRIPLAIQKGFVALSDRLETVPSGMAPFFAICEKNTNIQGDLLKGLNDADKFA